MQVAQKAREEAKKMEEYDLEIMRQQIRDCLDYVDDPGMLDLVYKLLASSAAEN